MIRSEIVLSPFIKDFLVIYDFVSFSVWLAWGSSNFLSDHFGVHHPQMLLSTATIPPSSMRKLSNFLSFF